LIVSLDSQPIEVILRLIAVLPQREPIASALGREGAQQSELVVFEATDMLIAVIACRLAAGPIEIKAGGGPEFD
jgi:hypothetical protein